MLYFAFTIKNAEKTEMGNGDIFTLKKGWSIVRTSSFLAEQAYLQRAEYRIFVRLTVCTV